jgi:large subunit ribosomal protein L5
MFFFETYFQRIIKYDTINTFNFNNLEQIPELKTIILNFGYQKSNFKRLISGLLALEFITLKKSKLTRSKHLHILLKIKQGNPVGCKIVLKKKAMQHFYLKLITSVFPKLKTPKNSQYQQHSKAITIVIQNPLLFVELESHYEFFKNMPNLDVTLLTNSKTKNELFFLLKSIKIFL